jgi:hypothetical protein
MGANWRAAIRLARANLSDYLERTVEPGGIPKWDGDLGLPNVYIPASKTAMARKVELLLDRFGSQRPKDWFDPQVFTGLARLRGSECRAPDGFAEAFHVRKLALQ